MTAPLLLHVFPSFGIGGAQARFVTLANSFGSRFRHAIVAMDGDRTCAVRLRSDLQVTFPMVEIHKGDIVRNLLLFRSVLKGLRPDVLITSNWGSIEWAMANAWQRVPHVHMEDGFGSDERDRQLQRRVRTRCLVLRRSLVMLPSRTLLKIATETWRINPQRLRYIPNGIELGRFTPSDRSFRDGTSPCVIGTVASLRSEKNLARLLRAFALLRVKSPARLVIVGDGPERYRLTWLAEELGIAADTEFVGHVDDPAPVYSRFDIFALSSDTEQMPISVLEAMASSLPVAATDVGDVAAMIAPENAMIISPIDAEALAARLALLVGEPALRHRLGAANRARAERDYDVVCMVNAHADLLDEACATVGRTPHPTSKNSPAPTL